jgi:Ca2+-dependent lipid-binding protein
VSATGLKSADLNEKSDPYVRLTLAGQQAKSKTIMKSLDPHWDETFEFVGVRGELVIVCASPSPSPTTEPSIFIVIPLLLQLKHKLHLNVFDWDRFSMDDKLGFACLNLEPMLHTLEHAEEVELSEQGSVSLRLRWVPQALSATTKDAGGALPVIQAQQPQKVMGKLCVHLLRGEGLQVAKRNGLSDPFVKLSFRKKTHTSKTIKKTLNPRWDSKFEFQCTQDMLDTAPLKLSVFNWDPISALSSRNESLGYASIDLSPLLTSTSFWSSKKHYTLELQKTKDGPSAKTERGREEATSLGRLHLNVSWEGEGMGSLLGPIFAASTKLIHAAAKCIVNPLQEDPIVVPAHHHGKAWAARQYFMSTFSGPREGECSERPVPLGWLDQMMEDGHLPRDLKVWRVDGGKAWVSLGQEIKAEIKAELKAQKNEAAEASTSV